MSGVPSMYLGPGAGLARLHQLGHALEGSNDRQSSDYWKMFAQHFFSADAVMHLVLWNPATRERKGFEVPEPVIQRWFHTNFASGVCSMSLLMDAPREYISGQRFPSPPRSTSYNLSVPSQNVSHFVECARTTWIMRFENGWQVQIRGYIRALYVPSTSVVYSVRQQGRNGLLLESFDFIAESYQSLISTSALPSTTKEERIPDELVAKILEANGLREGPGVPTNSMSLETSTITVKLEGDGEDSVDNSRSATTKHFTMKTNSISVPESPVNEYGITLRAMRCLEITESVCQLRDLMDFTNKQADKAAIGPIAEGLRSFVSQHKEQDRLASKEFVERRGQYEAAR